MIPCQSPEDRRLRDRWKHDGMPVLGLIGGIGGGKSSAARMLAERGAVVIDADAVGHELLEDPSIRARVVERFGAGVLEVPSSGAAEWSRISRKALASIVFGDAEALRNLEAILHPAMRDHFRRTIDRLAREGGRPCIVLDAAVLLEAGWDDLCDWIAFVDAPRPERLRRVKPARGWSEATFEARERSQWPVEEKRRRADWVIANDGGPDHLRAEVARLFARLNPAAPTGVSPAASSPVRDQDDPMSDEQVPDAAVAVGRWS
jgi:dephospho-CoA kinase